MVTKYPPRPATRELSQCPSDTRFLFSNAVTLYKQLTKVSQSTLPDVPEGFDYPFH